MTWVNTTQGDLINLDVQKEIKLYDLEYEEQWLGTMICSLDQEGSETILGFCDGCDAFPSIWEIMIYRKYYHFGYSFDEMCKKNITQIKDLEDKRRKENLEHDTSQFHDIYTKWTDQIEPLIQKVWKGMRKTEIQIELY